MTRSLLPMALLVLIASPGANAAQIQTGHAAVKRFKYMGSPVHPLCVGSAIESTRRQPHKLVECSATGAEVKAQSDGWREADYPPDADDLYAGYVKYKVLGRKGREFLVASEWSGGGSGVLTQLFWASLESGLIMDVRDVLSGDRCDGQLAGFRVHGKVVEFEASATAEGVLTLAGVQLDRNVSGQMWGGFADCKGTAHYRYDLANGQLRLQSLQLNGLDKNPAWYDSPRACEDRLIRRRRGDGKVSLGPEELAAFGREFVAECAPARQSPENE
jgi:hypothetical protein